MLIFDLVCHNDHAFEGWFKDLSELEKQIEDKLLSCPVCGSTKITRLPSTFGIGRSKAGALPAKSAGADALPGPAALQETKKAMLLRQLESLSEKLREDFADVGPQFTTEALKMHYGAAPKRNIMGMSTEQEEEVLKSEGIEFFKVPMLVRKPSVAS
ncbi:MAG: DUF1178 family protein [Deltaproteobacteria bacterium]|jgi:hypothetical protein|nr:DUF1178 family protein [Deltaproteobacteria bacterium]